MQRAILFLFLSLSLTSWYCMETDSHTHRLVGPSNRGIILVFLSLVAITKFSGNTLSGSFNTRVQKKLCFRPKSPFIWETIGDICPWITIESQSIRIGSDDLERQGDETVFAADLCTYIFAL